MKRINRRTAIIIGAVLVALGLLALLAQPGETPPKDVPLTEALSYVEDDKVEKATINDNTRSLILELEDGTKVRSSYPTLYGGDLVELFGDAEPEIEVKVEDLPEDNPFLGLLYALLPVVLIIGFLLYFLNRQGRGGMGVGKLGKKRGAPVEIPSIRLGDVVGAEEAVTEMQEVVDFLHNPDRFREAGAKVPHGYLLVGPPGTGKTHLARAVAGEAGVPFFALAGSDFTEVFVGVGASRMREIFEKAKEAGRAIIFIDEIDAVGKARSSGPSNGSTDERESTLNALLVEMDGFEKTGVVVLAATNRADVLDPALMRPGRFDRRIAMPAPDRTGRQRLFELYAKGRAFGEEIDWASMGRRTPGLTGADVSFLMNEAALEAARNGRKEILNRDLESALATAVLGRERKSAVIVERDRRITAWHEAGHALLALLQEDADDPVSLTIIPRGEAGGVTWMGGNDFVYITKSQAKAQLAVSLAGRAAEERLLGGDYTQGASGDLQAATDLATKMVALYGMSETGRLAHLSGERLSVGNSLDAVTEEVDGLLQEALQTARVTLAQHANLLEAVVAELLEKETLSVEDMVRIQLDVEGRLAAKEFLVPEQGSGN